MGAFTLAYPEPFLETSSVGFSLPSLLDELDKATLQGVTGGNVLFVVDTIVPVLSRYPCSLATNAIYSNTFLRRIFL